MLTLVLQCAVALATLAAGPVALRVAATLPPRPAAHGAGAWEAAGLTFLLMGLSGVAQNAGAVAAVAAGAGTPVYQAYLRWSPVGNHGRNLLVVLLGVLLLVGAARGGRWRAPRSALVAAMGAALAAGGALGWMEGPLETGWHFAVVALMDLVGLTALFAALLVALARSAFDRLLWYALVVLALYQALGVLWFSGLALGSRTLSWSPPPWGIQAIGLLAWLAVLALAARRLSLARRGVVVSPPLHAPGAAVRRDSGVRAPRA